MLDFRSFGLADKPAFDALTALQGRVENSELSFANLFMWRTSDHIRFCHTQDALFIRCTAQHLQPLLEPQARARAAVDAALDDLAADGLQPRIVGVNEQFVLRLQQEDGLRGLDVQEDRNMFEYVYDAQSLATLSGKRLHAKRNHANRFYAQFQYECVDLTSAMLAQCLAVHDAWSDGEPPESAASEREAVVQAVGNLEALSLVGLLIRVSGRPAAFTVAERLNPAMGLVHLEKAAPDVPGLFSVINQQCVQRFFADAQYINREEDMGMPGLRQAKLSYNPVHMIKKYVIRRQP